MNLDKGTVRIGDKDYFLNTNEFPTVDMNNPYELTMEEMFLMGRFRADFINSMALERHINFLYDKGSIYKIHNGNLLFHGCVPLDEQGVFDGIVVDCKSYSGREYLDYCESMVRQARTGDSDAVDFMWFLWSNILKHLKELFWTRIEMLTIRRQLKRIRIPTMFSMKMKESVK